MRITKFQNVTINTTVNNAEKDALLTNIVENVRWYNLRQRTWQYRHIFPYC